MRLLTTSKIYRAFPELDQFDDVVCKQYVRFARRADSAWWGRGLVVLSFPVSFVLWIGFVWLAVFIFDNYVGAPKGPDWVDLAIGLFFGTGFVWFPLVCALITRDITLRRAIRKRLDGVTCAACGYNLVGLAVFDEVDRRAVRCPECGAKTALNEGHITEADINPALLAES